MKKLLLPVLLLVHSLGSLSAADRVALVIGNDAYQHARKLNAAVNDATAVGLSLKRLGFQVIQVRNGGVETMLEAVVRAG